MLPFSTVDDDAFAILHRKIPIKSESLKVSFLGVECQNNLRQSTEVVNLTITEYHNILIISKIEHALTFEMPKKAFS